MSPSVSVALATYNGGRYLEEQLRSILDQVPPPAELVVADDGSTDDTLAIVERVAAEYPTVRLRMLAAQATPLGVAGNFTRAIGAATGDLVALSDQDDRWHPGRLAAVLAHFDDPQVTFVHHDAELVDGAGERLDQRLLDWLRITPTEREQLAEGRAFEAYLRRNLATGATVVFRRSLAQAALPIGEGWIHDEWLAIIAAAQDGARLDPAALVDYRQHGANEIGVSRPTLRYLLGRMLRPRGDRYVWLAARSAALAARLESMGVDERWLGLAREKSRFESRRAQYPSARLARVRPILAQRRDYARLSSQGTLDIVRDLMHPA